MTAYLIRDYARRVANLISQRERTLVDVRFLMRLKIFLISRVHFQNLQLLFQSSFMRGHDATRGN